MVNISKRDLAVIAGLAGAADFLAEGRFTAPLARALKTVIRRGGPTAARFTGATALRAAGTALSVGKTIAMRHPVLTGGAVVYYTYQNRDELGGLVEQGYEVVQDFADITRAKFDEGIQPITGSISGK
jgi:putative intracellular protease/amidase